MQKTPLKLLFIGTLFTLIISMTACSAGDLAMVYNPAVGLQTGAWQMAALVEMNTNFSSLIFDKTEARFTEFNVKPLQLLPDNASFYILPVIQSDYSKEKRYDETYSKIMGNYLMLNGYGRAVNSVEAADYVIVINVRESASTFHNSSSVITVTIMEKDETPLFFVNTVVQSKSDRNFYYHMSKSARPVTYLTLKGFDRIFTEAMPQAFS